jgi:alcohol dehydrogenase (cytochrome c)
MRIGLLAIVGAVALASAQTIGQVRDFVPVTDQMLLNPGPNDWLMGSRTYDNQRFSPLDQINRGNVSRLRMAWARGMVAGTQETIPIVYRGVMYVITPSPSVQALDATNGDLLWEYRRPGSGSSAKTLSIYDDLVFWTAPDSSVIALDARSGQVRWEVKADIRGHSGGSIVVDGKVITNGRCLKRASCYISAYDARTGKEAWRFYTAAGKDDPVGDQSWGTGAPEEGRQSSPWGLPGSYDPVLKTTYWGVGAPGEGGFWTRRARHGGNPNAIPTHAPADLYSDSTVALDPATGKLRWYYQHVPGDDWDQDGNQVRMLLRTPIKPDPKHVKWINPKTNDGQPRDVVVNIPEGGGIFVLDRKTGQFLWATPFPYDNEFFHLSKIDVETGITYLNEKLLVSEYPGARKTVCFWNVTSFWPFAYDPRKNLLYTPYIDNCVDMQSAAPESEGRPAIRETRRSAGAAARGVDPDQVNGLARIDMATGEVQRWHTSRIPTNGAVVATAGDLLFWGDLNRRFRAFDSDTGKVLWETIVGGVVTTSTITYAVNGKQYVAVLTGTSAVDDELAAQPTDPTSTRRGAPTDAGIKPSYHHNGIYVFALP